MSEESRSAEQIADLAARAGVTVAAAESLTSGAIASRLGAAPSAGGWFRGGVVAYASEVKFRVLGVPEGPVISEECARFMARGVAELMQAQVAVAVTGVGGPDEEEGEPVGTVWFGTVVGSAVRSELRRFDGDPAQIVAATTKHALHLLHDRLLALVAG